MQFEIKLISNSKLDTINLASYIAKFLSKGSLILLTGDLGAGKTTFTQGIAKGLGISENVISPTFNILKCYFHNPINLYHIDAYRLKDQDHNIGLEEFIEGDGACVIEWPIYIKELIQPNTYLKVNLELILGDKRKITISSNSLSYKNLFEELNKKYV